MAKFSIYSKDGQSVRHTGEPHFSGSYMGVDYIEFRTVSSPTPVTWEIGDYVDYYRTGLRYKLYSLPMPNKVARRGAYGASFEYSNVQLHAATKELEIAPFRDIVTEDNLIHFSTRQDVSTYENVYGIARRIQACMDDLYPGRWEIRVVETRDEALLPLLEEVKEFSISGASCLEALSQIYDTWKNVGWTHTFDPANDKDIIIIGQANVRTPSNTSEAYEYGIGKGLTSIRKAAANPDEFATRLYVYGSERNIQTRYYNEFDILNKDSVDIRNLMLPISRWGKTNGLPDARKAYIQASDNVIAKYGIIPRTVYFDGNEYEEIYPSINGLTCSEVREAMIAAGQSGSYYLPPDNSDRIDKVNSAYGWIDGSKEDIESYPNFNMHINSVGFDIAQQGKLTEEGHATISMKSGACGGRNFVVKKFELDKNNRPVLQIEKSWDESLGESFPNDRYPISEGDVFVLLDIPMPDYYITLAENRLYKEGLNLLNDMSRVSAFYEPSVDPIVIKDSSKILRAGMYMQVIDQDLVETEDKTDYVLIDTLTIDEASELPMYKITLREQKRAYRSFGVLEQMIEVVKEENKQGIASAKQYTERRFRTAKETMAMLEAAFKNFSEGINPVTVQTMAMLVGDESLQFKYIAATGNDITSVDSTLSYNAELKRMQSTMNVRLMHMTLGVTDVMPLSSRTIDSYLKWTMPAQTTQAFDVADNSYYIYAKVPKDGTSGTYEASIMPIAMEEVSGYYHFLVGILNSEYEGSRSFVPLYGFTEVLPGQITTDVIRSADGKTYFDLAGNVVNVGQKTGLSGSDALLRIWAGASHLERNNAPFRVTDDGHVFAQNAHIEGDIYADGGRIGALNITEEGLSVAEIPKDGKAGDAFGVVMITNNTVSFGGMRMINGSQATSVRNVLMNIGGSESDTPAMLVTSNDVAIRCNKGTFVGLRTSTRVLRSTEIGSKQYPTILENNDFNILIPGTSGTYYIALPQTPLDGQEYTIETFGADIFLLSTAKLWSHDLGKYKESEVSGYLSTHNFTSAGVIRFKYYSGENCWTYTWLESR